MIEKHIHKIGIKCKNLRLYCGVYNKHFDTLDAMNYLEMYLGMEQGIAYWRKLRHFKDQMKIDKKKGVEFIGLWVPE